MPRLSLYRPEKSNDYYFLDRVILEEFSVGGTDVLVHKYIGPVNPDVENSTADQPHYDVIKETNIQDLLFVENRDRKYDQDVYTIRGIYTVQDQDFDLSQFGLFLQNDTLFLTVHINGSVKTIGRKLIAGDVLELPHLKDEYALNDYNMALKRFYVIDEVSRAAEGFSQTWYPHLYRLRLKQLVASQEYQDILNKPADEDSDLTLGDIMSNCSKTLAINDAVIAQAESDALKSGYDITHFYTLTTNPDGSVNLTTVDTTQITADGGDLSGVTMSLTDHPPRDGYDGYLLGTGDTPNGAPFGIGIAFPANKRLGDYYLRTDFMPHRMFMFDGLKWIRVKDDVRMTMTPSPARMTQKGTFINNTATNIIGGEVVEERQSLSKALRPKADN
jgi:hypothetical protein